MRARLDKIVRAVSIIVFVKRTPIALLVERPILGEVFRGDACVVWKCAGKVPALGVGQPLQSVVGVELVVILRVGRGGSLFHLAPVFLLDILFWALPIFSDRLFGRDRDNRL